MCKAGSLKHSKEQCLYGFSQLTCMERSKPALLLSTVSACCAVVLPSFSLSASCLCVCVCVYMYLFFTLEDSSCLAFKFSGLFWSAMEGQTQVKVLLFLTWLHLAQSLGRICVLLLTEEGRGPAHLVTLNPLFGTCWLDLLIKKIKSRQLVCIKLFYVCIASSVCS